MSDQSVVGGTSGSTARAHLGGGQTLKLETVASAHTHRGASAYVCKLAPPRAGEPVEI